MVLGLEPSKELQDICVSPSVENALNSQLA